MFSIELLQQIAQRTAAIGTLDEPALEQLKAEWPALRFTLCNDDDMPARMQPALRATGFNLYLVGGGTHPGSGLPTIYESARISSNLLCRKHSIPFAAPSELQAKVPVRG